MTKNKFLFTIIVVILMATLLFGFIYFNKNSLFNHDSVVNPNNIVNNNEQIPQKINVNLAGTSYNGWLHTDGSILENEKNEPIQLHGLSSHGINWFSDVITKENMKYLKDNWNINVFRLAVYTSVGGDGYVFYPKDIDERISEIVDIAVDLDVYVIIDWHTLEDNNPQTYQNNAVAFFDKFSKKYSDIPNVIYEICNEPNGNDVTWVNNVKPYAESIIPVIRQNSPKSLIIVGTPSWCTDLKSVVNNPISFENVMYSCHFYSGSHGKELRNEIIYCQNNDIPIFISECGLTDASGNGLLYFDSFIEWIEFINLNNLSWTYWSFSNKFESSAILTEDYTNNQPISDYLTESGIFIKKIFEDYTDKK